MSPRTGDDPPASPSEKAKGGDNIVSCNRNESEKDEKSRAIPKRHALPLFRGVDRQQPATSAHTVSALGRTTQVPPNSGSVTGAHSRSAGIGNRVSQCPCDNLMAASGVMYARGIVQKSVWGRLSRGRTQGRREINKTVTQFFALRGEVRALLFSEPGEQVVQLGVYEPDRGIDDMR